MPRPKRKMSIWVERDDLWWCGKKYGWLDIDDIPSGIDFGNQRKFNTVKRARAHAVSCGTGTIIGRLSHYNHRKGGRKCYIEEMI